MRVCGVCRHLQGRSTDGMEAPLDAWCPIWRMRITAPAVVGCTLFEAWEEPAGEEGGETGRSQAYEQPGAARSLDHEVPG